MFKVVRLLDGGPAPADGWGELWSGALASGASGRGRPLRVALAEPLAGFSGGPFAAVELQWFADEEAALASEAWLRAAAPDLLDGWCRVVAEEVVLRGRDYLDARWEAGGERYKMMSLAKRNPRLSPAEFSARWRAEAGNLGAERVPAEVRGQAYVQNHPVPLAGHDWPFDAVNEVYADSLDDVRRRAEWFAARPVDPDGLFSPTDTCSLFLRELALPTVG